MRGHKELRVKEASSGCGLRRSLAPKILPRQVLVADFVANSKPGEGLLKARKRIALGELVRVS
jgi:hypothetical protein